MAYPRKAFAGLTTADKDYIKRNYDLLAVKQLADDTWASVPAVQKFIDTLPVPPASTEPKAVEPATKPQPVPDVKPQDSITGTAVFKQSPIIDEDRGIAVMTQGAAQWADEAARRDPGQNYVANNKDRIFKPRPDKPSK